MAFLCIASIALVGGIVIMVFYYEPDNFVFPEGSTYRGVTPVQPEDAVSRPEHSPNNNPAIKLIGGICALLLLGYLLVICYQKFMKDSKADSVDTGNAFREISLESGQTEYELFVIASKEWSIAESQIDKDFKNYMAASVLPFYVMDLVRKNNDRIDGSLKKIEEMEPTSRWDLVKALLIFPGCFFLLIFLLIVFHPDFVKY